MRGRRLEPGKVPWEVVAPHLPAGLPPGVVLGPARGEDAALVEAGGEVWAVASDPVTFAAADAGRLAVIVNANDVAVGGARPAFFTAVVLLAPGDADEARVGELLGQVRDACAEVGAALVGGHTEVTPGLPRSVVVGTMIGRVAGRPVTSGGLRPGHRVGLTRWAGLEGTVILGAELGEGLGEVEPGLPPLEAVVPPGWLSVVEDALALAAVPGVTALHDVTEGGVGEALHELAAASGVRVEADREAVPLLPHTSAWCGALGLDPLGLIGSGAVLVGCREEAVPQVEAAMAARGTPLAWIGRAAAGKPGVAGIPRHPRDEIVRTFAVDGVAAALLDLDGTLVLSRYDWPAIRAELGIRGPSILDELAALPEAERSEKWRRLEELEAEASAAAEEAPGARELLALLRDAGWPVAVVTNTTAELAGRLLARFGLEPDAVVTREVGAWKPSPEPLRCAAERLGVPVERCLAVGDARLDVEAARAAGCRAVAVVGPLAEELRHRADLAFPTLPELVRCLRVLLRRP